MAACKASVKAAPMSSPGTGSLNWQSSALNCALSTTFLHRRHGPILGSLRIDDFRTPLGHVIVLRRRHLEI